VSAQKLSHFGIGASEIAAVAGLNPFASPWDVYLRKTGQAPDIEETAPMEWGNRLEPAIRKAYADHSQLTVLVPTTSIFRSDVRWARATPDGVVFTAEPANDVATSIINPTIGEAVPASGADRILQIKNVGAWVEKSWDDAPPAYVQLQEQWELFVTGLARADVAVLIGGNDFRVYTIHRDDKMITDLVSIADAFWRRVEARTPPPIDESDACKEHFERAFTKSTKVEMVADEELEAAIAKWKELHAEEKRVERELKQVRNIVRASLAGAQADRVKSAHGTPYLINPQPKPDTNWQLVAELLGSTKCGPEEFKALVSANTNMSTPSRSLYPPRSWSKEEKETA
jgi:putative phage-type endonuclease